jgi:hypothetical protein
MAARRGPEILSSPNKTQLHACDAAELKILPHVARKGDEQLAVAKRVKSTEPLGVVRDRSFRPHLSGIVGVTSNRSRTKSPSSPNTEDEENTALGSLPSAAHSTKDLITQ